MATRTRQQVAENLPVEEEEEEEEQPNPRARAIVDDDDDDDEPPAKGHDDDYDEDEDDDDSIVLGDDWDDAEEQGPLGDYPTVDRGPYVVMLADAETRRAGETAKHPGSKYGTLVFKVQAEDNPTTMEEEAQTVTIWHNLFFTPKAIGRTKRTASDMGLKLKAGDDIIGMMKDLSEDEARFDAVVGIEKYRAQDQNTGKMANKKRNVILRIIGPADI